MKSYAGIDLNGTNSVIVVLDNEDPLFPPVCDDLLKPRPSAPTSLHGAGPDGVLLAPTGDLAVSMGRFMARTAGRG